MPEAVLDTERFLSLVTFRQDGSEVATPVWFALHEGDLLIGTFADSGKAKRIRAGSRVKIATCNFRGLVNESYRDASARILEGEAAATAEERLVEKYGWQWRLFGRRIDCFLAITL